MQPDMYKASNRQEPCSPHASKSTQAPMCTHTAVQASFCGWHMQTYLVNHVKHTALGEVIRAYLHIQLHYAVPFLWVLGLGSAPQLILMSLLLKSLLRYQAHSGHKLLSLVLHAVTKHVDNESHVTCLGPQPSCFTTSTSMCNFRTDVFEHLEPCLRTCMKAHHSRKKHQLEAGRSLHMMQALLTGQQEHLWQMLADGS